MRTTKLSHNVLYIEDAFPDVAEFLSALEEQDSKGDLEGIIPQWSKWAEGGDREWIPVKTEREAAQQALLRGNTRITKLVDWDITINEDNTNWPRVQVDPDYSNSHESAYKIDQNHLIYQKTTALENIKQVQIWLPILIETLLTLKPLWIGLPLYILMITMKVES